MARASVPASDRMQRGTLLTVNALRHAGAEPGDFLVQWSAEGKAISIALLGNAAWRDAARKVGVGLERWQPLRISGEPAPPRRRSFLR